MQVSGLTVPQQLPNLAMLGLFQVPLGFPVRFTVNVGTVGSHCEKDSKQKKDNKNMRSNFDRMSGMF
jgi:hypothetical protein